MRIYNPDEAERKAKQESREAASRTLKPILTQMVENAAALERFTKALSEMFAGLSSNKPVGEK